MLCVCRSHLLPRLKVDWKCSARMWTSTHPRWANWPSPYWRWSKLSNKKQRNARFVFFISCIFVQFIWTIELWVQNAAARTSSRKASSKRAGQVVEEDAHTSAQDARQKVRQVAQHGLQECHRRAHHLQSDPNWYWTRCIYRAMIICLNLLIFVIDLYF